MNSNIKPRLGFFLAVMVAVLAVFGCGKLTELVDKGDKLYFCENYIPSTDDCVGESSKYTTGTLTVMAKLEKPIGVRNVNINITDKSSGEAIDTYPYTVSTDMDYIYFDGVNFKEPGNYKVSLLKEDGTVVVSNEIEIIK